MRNKKYHTDGLLNRIHPSSQDKKGPPDTLWALALIAFLLVLFAIIDAFNYMVPR